MVGNSSEDTDLDSGSKYFKCCKSKTVSVVICARCGGVFHNSCVDRQKNVQILGDNKIICCKEKKAPKSMEVTFLEKQVNLLEELNKQKEIVIKDKEEIIKLLYDKIGDLENKINNIEITANSSSRIENNGSTDLNKINLTNMNYAEALSRKKENILVIKPINKQESIETKKNIKEKINIADIKVAISNIKEVSNGGILLQCTHEDDLTKLKEETVKKLGKNYDIRESKLHKPCLKIVGLDEELDEDRLKRALINQNRFINEDANIKLVVTKKMKMKWFAIIECDGETFKKTMDNGAVCVEYSACSVYEYIRIVRCFKCCGYDHMVKDCTKHDICAKCGQRDHGSESCGTVKNCPNCSEANGKGDNFNTNHSPFDLSCCAYIKKLNSQRGNIDYNSK